MQLQIEQRELEGGVVVISLTGKLLLGPESQQLENIITRLLGDGRLYFVFDLSGVSHIDSTGIGRFIFGFNKVMQAGGKMLMAGATGQVRDGFRITRLDTVFKFYPDVQAARQALA